MVNFLPMIFKLFDFPMLLLRVLLPYTVYSRNALCILNYIAMFLLSMFSTVIRKHNTCICQYMLGLPNYNRNNCFSWFHHIRMNMILCKIYSSVDPCYCRLDCGSRNITLSLGIFLSREICILI